MPDEIYAFTERTYENLARAGISPLSILDVLHGRRVIRRPIGAFLQIAGHDRDGHWIAVALMEDEDDSYTVTSARYLDEDETAGIARMMGEQP